MVKAIFLASRPKTLAAAVFPVAVGTTLAKAMGFELKLDYVAIALVSALLIQIATNFFNDAIDFEKGADNSDRLGPSRAVQSGWMTSELMKRLGFSCLAATFLLALPVIYNFGWPVLLLCLVCLYFAYGYTGGPFPLAYKGLGEVFVVMFFGVVAVGGSFFLHSEALRLEGVVAGLQIGFLSTVLLAINNLRDINQDADAGKKTLVVRLGKKFGRWEILCLSCSPYLMGLFWVKHSLGAFLLPLLVIPISFLLCLKIFKHEPSKVYNKYLGLGALQLMMFALMLSMGFLWMQ
ncbi:1,4-dihydroxy-2-naphthoate octaprenyltransferase [bacterium]|nr:1,4-dihydroxy-2-naphthoate octaprenyltransferase [bacterium]